MGDVISSELLPLDKVVCDLREQIAQLVLAAPQDGVVFKVGNIELEFSVVAKREGGADGKVKFSVLGIGAEIGAAGKIAQERVQKVKLTLMPQSTSADGGLRDVRISKVG